MSQFIKSNTLGRLFTVNPRHTECFYLRLLLVNVTGPLSFQDGEQYPTYKDACLVLGLLQDDNQWECMLAEVALNCTAIQIRLLFGIVLTHVSQPDHRYWGIITKIQ